MAPDSLVKAAKAIHDPRNCVFMIRLVGIGELVNSDGRSSKLGVALHRVNGFGAGTGTRLSSGCLDVPGTGGITVRITRWTHEGSEFTLALSRAALGSIWQLIGALRWNRSHRAGIARLGRLRNHEETREAGVGFREAGMNPALVGLHVDVHVHIWIETPVVMQVNVVVDSFRIFFVRHGGWEVGGGGMRCGGTKRSGLEE